ncbi:hypothetical protein [Microvirga massiliensis]|uniref:hypothetical protein n=1 Tax=Microvirga massiliensis TaxID=1033741 RepID=UPI000B02329D|nr:hypothetical protein [Microvirga massiliensis]
MTRRYDLIQVLDDARTPEEARRAVGALLLEEWPFMPPDLREISATALSGNTKTDCEMIVRRAMPSISTTAHRVDPDGAPSNKTPKTPKWVFYWTVGRLRPDRKKAPASQGLLRAPSVIVPTPVRLGTITDIRLAAAFVPWL